MQGGAKKAHIVSGHAGQISTREIGSLKVYESVVLAEKIQPAEIAACKRRALAATEISQMACCSMTEISSSCDTFVGRDRPRLGKSTAPIEAAVAVVAARNFRLLEIIAEPFAALKISWRKVGETPWQDYENAGKLLKILALPRGIEPLFQP